MNLLENLINLIFPPKCPLCQKIQDAPGICAPCRASAPWVDPDTPPRLLSQNRFPCTAPLYYHGPVRDSLLRLKFHGCASAAGPLGDELGRCVEEAGYSFDLVTWTPVSRRRLRRRGYDQARLIAESACRRWNAKPVRLLQKVRHNAAQSGLDSAARRAENVKDVYRPAGDCAGKRILLIDDICTTGSTLSACAGTLLEAGAAEILCAVVALTDFGGENG